MTVGNNQMKVYNVENRLVLCAPLSQSRTFQVKFQSSNSQCLASEVIHEAASLWHLRTPKEKGRNCLVGKQARKLNQHHSTATIQPTLAHDEAQVRRAERASKSHVWRKAMEDEIQSIEKNNAWKLMSLPTKRKPIAVKQVYEVKHLPDGSIAKHRAKPVARGLSQNSGIDFNKMFCQSGVETDVGTSCGTSVHSVPEFQLEILAPVARLETVRPVVVIANQVNWQSVQQNVKSAFDNGKLEEEVYVEQPQGFKVDLRVDFC
ncbi:reverse transcriptase [Trifolium medium]|uniref:Reverse transcriptase n=1 Tax=Trifolium medium TaxID=97028 RepID=A0A392ML21_9FABA|nr:reverse transcriptase [Trifolium medium]